MRGVKHDFGKKEIALFLREGLERRQVVGRIGELDGLWQLILWRDVVKAVEQPQPPVK
jgi:hypothetical protein